MLETATGVKAFSVGKPSRRRLTGYRTVLVLTGSTKLEDLRRYAYRPDLVVNSIADLAGSELIWEHGSMASPIASIAR